MYSVYRHTSPSGKVYIGITKRDPEKRWNNGRGYAKCTIFQNAIIKYGWDNIKHDILAVGLEEGEAKAMEITLIAYYKSLGISYNISAGGDGCVLPIERRKYGKENKTSVVVYQYSKKGEFIKKWDCISDVQRELGILTTNISAACRGKTFTVAGYRWSYDYPYVFSEEERRKRAETRRKQSEIAKLGFVTGRRKPLRGKDNPLYGKRRELCAKYGLRGKLSPIKKTVYQYTKNGEFVKMWECIVDIVNEFGYKGNSISANCVGKIPSAYGFVWSHLSPDEYTPDSTNRHLDSGKPRKVYQYDLNRLFIQEWPSTMDIQRKLGYSNSQISSACRSGHKAHGYYWSYIETTKK